MKKLTRKTLIAISLGYFMLLPLLFYLKSIGEPLNWWLQSAWHPLEVLLVLEILLAFSVLLFYLSARAIKKHQENNHQ